MAALRAELAAIEPTRRCCRVAERAGLAGPTRPRPASPPVARLALRLQTDEPGAQEADFSWARSREHCRFAYLRGRFLAHGSLSLAAGRTHLEFVLPEAAATELAGQLAEVGLPASRRVRRGRGVVTWKSSETLLAFLGRAGASAGALEMEARLVTRALVAQLNRVLNAEGANLDRSVSAARRQLDAIEALDVAGRLRTLPEPLRSLALLRSEAPEATLGELASQLGTTRSAVQRSLARLEALAGQGDEGLSAPR